MKALALLLFIPLVMAADPERPNILFAFADDWGCYASAYAAANGPGSANDVVRTPHFDRVAKEGVLFRNAFVTAPSCTPCRSSLLSGQYFYRTGRAAILQGAVWDPAIPSFPLLLRDSGYHIGKVYKVWSPGVERDAPYGGQQYDFGVKGPNMNAFSQVMSGLVKTGSSVEAARETLLSKVKTEFDGFLNSVPADKPFCFWFGPTNVHRKWTKGSGKALWGLEPDDLKGKLPRFLPDVHEVREDFADYLGEAMAFDAALGVLLAQLEAAGELENTLIVVSGDHGAPGFPRGKCNLYDFGTHVPLVVSWGGGTRIPAGRVVDDFVNLMDLAPTFLEAGKVPVPEVMTGNSLMPVLTAKADGQVDPARSWVVTGRERHVAKARAGGLPYPQRAIRTPDHLYIVNFTPDRWPMGDPGGVTVDSQPAMNLLENSTFSCFADLDASPTKAWMVNERHNPAWKSAWDLGFGKRPAKELYVLASDPDQMVNRSGDPTLAVVEAELHKRLMAELTATGDPRVTEESPRYEKPPFAGAIGK